MVPNHDTETARVGDKRAANGDTASTHHRARTEPPLVARATLPLVALELVFSYALVDLTVQIHPIPMMHHRAVARRVDDAFSLRKWSSVCRDWRDAIEQLIDQYQAGTVKLEFVLNRQEDLERALATEMRRKRHMIQDVRVGIYRRIDDTIKPTLVPIDWASLLSGLTNLQRLDLTGMNCLTCEEMCDVLTAASSCCPKLHALILPLPHGWIRPPCLIYDRRVAPGLYRAYKPLIAALGSALEKWHTIGGASGSALEHLVFPCMGAHADDFIALVTQFVPRIQVLDAWKLTYFSDGWDDIRCDEHWHISKETWSAFCQTCTNLREFNLGLVPPAEEFMIPFTLKKKWLLKELTINYTRCSSPQFTVLNEHQQMVARLRPSFYDHHYTSPTAISSANLSSLVQALPRLEVLRINLPSRGDKNLEAFDDDFFSVLAKSCPNLKVLVVGGGRGYSDTETLSEITDRGLAVIGDMPKLEELVLRPLETLTEEGLAKLLGGARHGRQLDTKLMLPPHVPPLVFKSLINRVAELLMTETIAPFVVQIAVQEVKSRPRFDPKSSVNKDDSGPLTELLDALRITRQELLEQQSRLRFQAFVDPHVHQLTQINVFTSDWKLRDGVDTLFFRTEIGYDNANRDTFEWIVTN